MFRAAALVAVPAQQGWLAALIFSGLALVRCLLGQKFDSKEVLDAVRIDVIRAHFGDIKALDKVVLRFRRAPLPLTFWV